MVQSRVLAALSDIAYDSARKQVVLFGWSGCVGCSSETWIWNGTTWTQLFPSTSPPPRMLHSIIYDSIRNEVVLFGGYDNQTGNSFDDTWVWDGTNWIQRFRRPVLPEWILSQWRMTRRGERQLFGAEFIALTNPAPGILMSGVGMAQPGPKSHRQRFLRIELDTQWPTIRAQPRSCCSEARPQAV